jgi:chromosomal replication initiator protein
MDNKQQDIWKKVLESIKSEVSEGNYMMLFKKTTLISLEENVATIAAPSTMIIDMIQKRFLGLLKETISQQYGNDIEIAFTAKSAQPKKETAEDTPLFSQKVFEKPTQIGHLPRVRPEYTFEAMAVSSSNQLAFISAQTVAKNIGKMYNPLFIYGPVGVGKTHLMQAIANYVYLSDPSKKIIYISSEEFTNEVVEAIRTNQTQTMKKRFRNAYLLIIDDIQFLAGKDKVQEELFHTFNILIDNGSQIVLSSDRPPHEIKKLEARLSSRFAGGLTVDVEVPDFELRTAILLIKAKKYNVVLSMEAAKTLAEEIQDARSLEGALLRIITSAHATGAEITEELVLQTLHNKPKEEKDAHLHPDDIIQRVCSYYNIKATLLKGPKRDASLVKARQITMYLLKKELKMTLVEIGNVLGGRDHTTVMHGVDKIEKSVDNKTALTVEISGITRAMRE